MSASTPAPALMVSWSRSEPTPVKALPPPVWTFSAAHEGKRLSLRVEFSYDEWSWSASVDRFGVFGYAADAESAKQDAQAVIELYLSGRPLFLDRRPTLSVSMPTEPQPAGRRRRERPGGRRGRRSPAVQP